MIFGYEDKGVLVATDAFFPADSYYYLVRAMDGEYIMMFCTVPSASADVGRKIALGLIDAKLVPCVNIVPGLKSLYMWKDKLNEDDELLLLIKTRRSLFEAVRDKIKELHPYEVPEIIATRIVAGYQPYLEWIKDNTTGD